MRFLITLALFLAATPVVGAPVALLVNGDAETGDLTGWTVTDGGTCAVSGLAHAGNWSLTGGVSGTSGPWTNTMAQVVDLGAHTGAIDAGQAVATFTGWARSNEAGGAPDVASVSIAWRDASGATLASYASGAVSPYNAWIALADERTLPAGTRSVVVALACRRDGGISTDGFFDDLSLVLATGPDPCAADINGDGSVDLSDIPLFAADYLAATNPARSDINGDGLVNLSDIPQLAAAIGTTGCP